MNLHPGEVLALRRPGFGPCYRRLSDGTGLQLGKAGDTNEVLVGVLGVQEAASQDPGPRLHTNAGEPVGVEEFTALDSQVSHPSEPLAVYEHAPQGIGEERNLLRVVNAAAHKRRRHRQGVQEVRVADRSVARRLVRAERVRVAQRLSPGGVVRNLPLQVQLREDRRPTEAVVAVGGIEEAAVALLVPVELDHGVCPLLAEAGQAAEGLRVLRLYHLLKLFGTNGFGGLGGGPLVYTSHQLQNPLHALWVHTAPKVINLAHRRKLVVLLPAPHKLAHPLNRRRVLRNKLYGHRITHVAAVRPRQVLGERLDLHLHARRVEGEVHRYAWRDLLHQAAPEDIIFEL